MCRKGWLDQRMREHEFPTYYASTVRTGIHKMSFSKTDHYYFLTWDDLFYFWFHYSKGGEDTTSTSNIKG